LSDRAALGVDLSSKQSRIAWKSLLKSAIVIFFFWLSLKHYFSSISVNFYLCPQLHYQLMTVSTTTQHWNGTMPMVPKFDHLVLYTGNVMKTSIAGKNNSLSTKSNLEVRKI
jgi:hypothetical protein